jgi:ribosomal protein S18 acetylase RimI-like enzyme
MNQLEIRSCSTADLQALRDIGMATFRAAFETQNNPEDFLSYLEKAFSPEQLTSELQHPHMQFYFVFQGTEIIGYFKLNTDSGQSEPEAEDAAELERFYVLPEHIGGGLGSQMMQHIVDLVKSWNKSYLWLGVWEMNRDAIRFYERHGFVKYNEHPYYVGNDCQTDWMMRLDFEPRND